MENAFSSSALACAIGAKKASDVNSFRIVIRRCAHQVDRLVFSSTAATYGLPERLPITEDEPNRPINPYGRSKLMVEQILEDTAKATGQSLPSRSIMGTTPEVDTVTRRRDKP